MTGMSENLQTLFPSIFLVITSCFTVKVSLPVLVLLLWTSPDLFVFTCISFPLLVVIPQSVKVYK